MCCVSVSVVEKSAAAAAEKMKNLKISRSENAEGVNETPVRAACLADERGGQGLIGYQLWVTKHTKYVMNQHGVCCGPTTAMFRKTRGSERRCLCIAWGPPVPLNSVANLVANTPRDRDEHGERKTKMIKYIITFRRCFSSINHSRSL